MNRFLFLLIFGYLTIVSGYTQSLDEWIIKSGNWSVIGSRILPIGDGVRQNEPFLLWNANSGREVSWRGLFVDFVYEQKTPMGILLNVKSVDDYQLLRLLPDAGRTLVQMLHWAYGKFRMWQEFEIPKSLEESVEYTISIIAAPPVDKEDWRAWKIVLEKKESCEVILKQGVDNEVSAFGCGQVGLYTMSTSVSFSNFHLSVENEYDSRKELFLPSIFSNGMVLQHSHLNPIWGKAKPGNHVKVRIRDVEYKTCANEAGLWMIQLPLLDAGLNLEIDIIAGNDSVRIKDIAVGEVWVASGQSNMEMRTWQTDVDKEVLESADSGLRLFKQPSWSSEEPMFSSGGMWQEASPSSVRGWSAIAYKFGQKLREELDMPIGIIASYWGGTAIESWIPREKLSEDMATKPILHRYNSALQKLQKGEEVDMSYPHGWDVPGQRHAPGALYNGMIYPLVPYTVKGVIWYQGESNAERAGQYEVLLPMLIDTWRTSWGNPDLPFFYVQLAGYDGKESGSDIDSAWPQLRDVQRRVLRQRNHTGMVVSFLSGDSLDIHPYRKSQIGLDLANLALKDTYHFDHLVARGPLYDVVSFSGNKVIVSFDETAAGLKSRDGKPIAGFIIAGKDRVFHPAKAVIDADGTKVVVSSLEVDAPEAVRYGWCNYSSSLNLVNSEGLSASPFRSDDWPLPTDKQR